MARWDRLTYMVQASTWRDSPAPVTRYQYRVLWPVPGGKIIQILALLRVEDRIMLLSAHLAHVDLSVDLIVTSQISILAKTRA
jgi:hypothetical protein